MAVPKFSSFKPTPAAPDQTVSTPEASEPRDDERRARKRRRHHSRRSPGDERKGRSGSKSRSRSRSPKRSLRAVSRPVAGDTGQVSALARVPARGDAPPAPSETNLPLFVVDKKGDPLIRKFGVDKYKAPQFRRDGRESVLGTEGYLYIHRDTADEQFSIRRQGEFYGMPSRDKNPLRSRIRHGQAKRLRASRDTTSHGVDTGDFISLASRRTRARRDEELSDGEGRPDYRSIEGRKTRNSLDSDVDGESSEPSDEEGAAERDPLTEKSIELTRRVKEHPNDIPAWLELIDHQDVLMKAGANINEDLPVDEVKSFAEIKLSMYEKALKHAESPRDRERLLVGQMREGAKVWDEDAMAARWFKLSNEIDTGFALWRAKLDFEMSSINTFHYDRVKEILIRRLVHLNTKAAQSPVQSHELGGLYSEMIYVFLRATRFFHDCGYRELAVAAWQALLELNFCRDDKSLTSQPSVPNSFEEFWESEAPRIGEKGAMGWDYFAKTGGPDAPEPAAAPTEVPSKSRDVYKAWAAEEGNMEKHARMPLRTLDETSSDDPYGIVMFSDLKDLLFAIPPGILGDLKGELFDAFCTFCHLPRLSKTRAWETDPLVAPVDKGFSSAVTEPFATSNSHFPPEKDPEEDASRPPPEFVRRRINPAIVSEAICSLYHWCKYAAGEDAPVDMFWVALTLKTLVERGHAELAGYGLVVSWLVGQDDIRKPAKVVIQRYPEDVGLYNLYAVAEWMGGKTEMAKNILSSATRLGEASSAKILPLWVTWAWIEFVEGAPLPKVLSRLCFATDSGDSLEEPSPTMVLRNKQELGSQSGQFLLKGDLDGFTISSKCVALLEYLSAMGGLEPRSERQGSISAAMDVIWLHSEALVAGGYGKSPQHEELLNFASVLLYMHTTLGYVPYPLCHWLSGNPHMLTWLS